MTSHPLLNYFDYKKAAIAVLQDYGTQVLILEHSPSHRAELRESLTSVQAPAPDATPGRRDPKAGEGRLCAVLDKVDLLKDREEMARAYLDWFNPAWAALDADDQFVLETFFLDSLPAEEAVVKVAERFYVERKSAFQKRQRALGRFTRLLFGRE